MQQHSSFEKRIFLIQSVFAFIGFLDATYLTIEHYLGLSIPCITGVGCDIVTRSAYSAVGPIPVALMGSFYYLLFLVACLYLFQRGHGQERYLWLFSWVGFLASVVFVSLQLFVIKAICIYCMGSAVTSTLLWLTSQDALRRRRRASVVGVGSDVLDIVVE